MNNNAKVIDIHSKKPISKPLELAPQRTNDRGSPAAFIAGAVLGFVRYVLFLLLFWLRTPIRFVLSPIAVLSMLALPLIWLGYSAPNKNEIILGLLAVGFGSFSLSWFYDSLLMRLSPVPLFLN